jgi:hypothetical protein
MPAWSQPGYAPPPPGAAPAGGYAPPAGAGEPAPGQAPYGPTPEQELNGLQQQAEMLSGQLEQINQRIGELEEQFAQ